MDRRYGDISRNEVPEMVRDLTAAIDDALELLEHAVDHDHEDYDSLTLRAAARVATTLFRVRRTCRNYSMPEADPARLP